MPIYSASQEADLAGAEIAKDAKTCPNCGAKNKKPLYKRVWFWILIAIVVIVVVVIIIASVGGSPKVKLPKARKR